MEMQEVLIKSSLDGTMQPSLIYRAKGENRPLMVCLHTWSFDRFNQVDSALPIAKEYDFNLILPDFRGPNLDSNPNCTLACGSEYAKRDIKDAVDYFLSLGNVDKENVFLIGASGGGHMAELMAGYCPEYFKAIAAFVGISNLNDWVGENPNYTKHILACCSGSADEMAKRSPVSYIDTIAKANIKIFHGKYDPSVPVTHSIKLFNMIQEKHPTSKVYLDIFDGGHTNDWKQAMYWSMSQYKKDVGEKVTG